MFPTKVTKPIIDIYPPTYQIGDMVYEPSIKEITAANHAAKQILDWISDNAVLRHVEVEKESYDTIEITRSQWQALLNLVKEK